MADRKNTYDTIRRSCEAHYRFVDFRMTREHPGLKDNSHRILPYRETRSDGTQIGKTAQYHIVGYYDPKASVTKDARYHIVGRPW